MKTSNDYFVVDSSNIGLTSIDKENVEEIIDVETGLCLNAKLGQNEIKVFIPAEMLDFIIYYWKTIDGQELSEMITD